jgi:uncharacterized protein (TIGR03083 family)
MDVESHVAALEREGRMLVDAAWRAGLDAGVPACPGWRVADLLAHVGFVHRWATRYVATALTEMVEEPDEVTILAGAPPGADRFDWVSSGHAALVGALRAAPPDLECWTFLSAPSPLAMWARRQAHETAVHRVDAEQAAGSPQTPVPSDLAVDGIDELLLAFFGRPPRRPLDVPGGAVTLGLEVVGTGERWTVRVSRSGVEAKGGAGDGEGPDVRVRGTPSDLYLLLWHRRPFGGLGALGGLEGLEVEGSSELFGQVWGPRGVTWS